MLAFAGSCFGLTEMRGMIPNTSEVRASPYGLAVSLFFTNGISTTETNDQAVKCVFRIQAAQ